MLQSFMDGMALDLLFRFFGFFVSTSIMLIFVGLLSKLMGWAMSKVNNIFNRTKG